MDIMDPIVSALLAFFDAHDPGPAATSAYRTLRKLLLHLDGEPNGVPNGVPDHLRQLEADPGSLSRRDSLRRALLEAGAAGHAAVGEAAAALLSLSCPATPVMAPAEFALAPGQNYAVVPVWFATDRAATGETAPSRQFGGARAPLSYGHCEISIPREHRMGELESRSLLRLEFRDNPAKHVVLLKTELQERDAFFATLAERLGASPGGHALLFVHGYNVSFEDAARRTGQMAYDLGFDGAPVFYSWPSQASLAGYLEDEANIEWSQANLTAFLRDFLGRTTAANIYLIAHSMGNRALTRALAALFAEQAQAAGRIREIILTAPDIDADVFRRDIVPALAGTANPITLYASSEDIALAASKRIHGYPRAGDTGSGLVVMDGVETIDATGVDTSFIKHSYFAERRSTLGDMFYLINNNARAAERFGLQFQAAGRYWTFKK